jgi:hypothetical protein
VKMKAFGIPPERPTPVPQPPPVDKGQATVGYAAVLERDPDGLPSRLHLPGPTAAPEISLFVGRTWAARVYADGRIGLGGDAGDALAAVGPGVRIVAATDAAGRVLALSAVAKPPTGRGRASTRARQASTAPPGRPGGRYDPDPGELLYSGAHGRILSVQ